MGKCGKLKNKGVNLNMNLKIQSLTDLEVLVGILVKAGYTVTIRKVFKNFPYETTIDYFAMWIEEE